MAKWDHDDLRDRSRDYETVENSDGTKTTRPVNVIEKGHQAIAALQARADALKTKTVLGTQIGGDHYTRQKIQPITYIWANGLGFSEGNVVKYVTRWKYKGGIKDLKKAHHHIALLIEEAERAEREDGVRYGL